MNIQKHFVACLALLLVLAIPTTLFSQDDEIKAQAHRDASIKRMQQRISEIESEMKEADFSHAQALGEEVFSLYGQIDSTYLQMKKSYQQQVIELNLRMQRKWEKVESAGVEDRDLINGALEGLEKDWDRTFRRLTTAHESHLEQIGDSLAKLKGEFSGAAGRAKTELEASNFEAVARWEQGHDLVLAINRTYVQIVNEQIRWQLKEFVQTPDDKEITERLAKTRTRYDNIQKKFQGRLSSHIQHLEKERETRQAQLNATSVWDTRREIMTMVDNLYARTHKTFEMQQESYRNVNQAYETEMQSPASTDQRVEKLTAAVMKTRFSLRDSYLSRIKLIDKQIVDFEARIEKGASAEEKANWKAKMTDLRLLARSLEIRAAQLAPVAARTVHR